MDILLKFINNNRKDLKWWQRNWFFVTTVFIVLLNIILYATLGLWSIERSNTKVHWNDCLNFTNLVDVFFSAYSHFNWQHTLLNMLCFMFCGIYLERKLGSVKFISLIVGLSFFGECVTSANSNSIYSYGFSGVNYALYAYILVDYLFYVIPRERRCRLNIIYGGIMLGLIYFAMCFNGGTQSVSFSWYPYDALYNLGHYTSYLVGLIIATFVCATAYYIEKKLQICKQLS